MNSVLVALDFLVGLFSHAFRFGLESLFGGLCWRNEQKEQYMGVDQKVPIYKGWPWEKNTEKMILPTWEGYPWSKLGKSRRED